MAEKVDLVEASEVLEAAIVRASDDNIELPADWVSIAREIGDHKSKTNIAVLVTGLLAKATNPAVDPLGLKPEPGRPRSISLRSVAEKVLVKRSRISPQFDLGAKGENPLNNQPYFRFSHIDDILASGRVRRSEDIQVLKHVLNAADELDQKAVKDALAAVLRERIRVAEKRRLDQVLTLPSSNEVQLLLSAVHEFCGDSRQEDAPVRLQGLVGGLVRSVTQKVSAQRLNDPSRHAPGDVHVPDSISPIWVAEIKCRSVRLDEAKDFLGRLEAHAVHSAWYVVIHRDHITLRSSDIISAALDRNIALAVIENLDDLIVAVYSHFGVESGISMSKIGRSVEQQLIEIDAGSKVLKVWRSIVNGRLGLSS